MNDRAKGGKCPKCTSADTIKIMSAPMFKPAGGGHSNTIK
ncbi:MAG: hypothetical protein NZ824_04270 [Candidatus Thioglobus sp.]|nr:hypothetical protein [Candidatus Thioglobus sp.]